MRGGNAAKSAANFMSDQRGSAMSATVPALYHTAPMTVLVVVIGQTINHDQCEHFTLESTAKQKRIPPSLANPWAGWSIENTIRPLRPRGWL